jgi:hypothetical protein
MPDARLTLAILVLTACMLVPVGMRAQGNYATITGAVTDPAHAAVPGATVEATNPATNYRYTAQSNESGIYTLPPLLPGRYSMKFSSPGFQELLIDEVEVSLQDIRRVDAQLKMGAVETKVEVKGGLGLIETETARVSNTITLSTIDALVVGRSLRNRIGLSSLGMLDSGSMRLGGSRLGQEWSSLDGVAIHSGSSGSFTSNMSNKAETFEVMRLDGVNNTAEFGTVAHVAIVTKSGSNDLHGSVYDFFSEGKWKARDPFSATNPTGVSHNLNFQVGGPIHLPGIYKGRDRTFFFASLESVSRGSQASQQTLIAARGRSSCFHAAT